MGAIAACGPCCGEEPRKSTADELYEDSSSSSSSDEDYSSPERKPFKKANKKAKKKKKKKRLEIERDESFISSENDSSDADKKRKKRRKEKKRQKKEKKNGKVDVEALEHAKQGGAAGGSENLLYGMDTKTMELLLDVQDISTSTPRNNGDAPEPSFPSIVAQTVNDPINPNDANKLNIIDTQNENKEAVAHSDDDMKIQLQKYSSTAMYDSAQNTPMNDDASAEMYETLKVEDEASDKLPDLPNNGNKNSGLIDEQRKKLGGLDYDFESIANEGLLSAADDEQDEERDALTKLNTLRKDEKEVDPGRVEMLHAHLQKSQGHEEMKKMIAAQYNMKSDVEDEEELHTDTESELDEEEMAEIERRKTEEMMKKEEAEKIKTMNSVKAKLFRPDTTTPWDAEDVHNAANEMKQHLEWMKRQHSSERNGDNMQVDHQISAVLKSAPVGAKNPADKKQSQLFRHKSAYKWDVDEMDKQNQEMQEHLVHLMQTHQNSNQALNT